MDVENSLPRRTRGLTLVELVTTLAVAGVSLAVVLPGWSAFAGRSQITSTANQLLTHLRYARNEAVTRQKKVSLCPSDDGESCSGDPRGWQRGYIVFIDNDGNRRLDPNEEMLRVQAAQQRELRLFSTAGRPAVTFSADGGAWGSNTTFSVCLDNSGDANRAVVLYGSGRARVDKKTADNRPVSCT